MSAGYLGVVMLFCQSSGFDGVKRAFASVGRLALTNYLLQTLLCTWIFYGHGLGWFQETSRIWQMAIVGLVWAFQFVFSSYWLREFRFGPFEWLWRSLTYWKVQPILRASDA